MKVSQSLILGSFLYELNHPNETPFGIDNSNAVYRDISWNTFYGNKLDFFESPLSILAIISINPFVLLDFDGLVNGNSVPLEGVNNYGTYSLTHNGLLKINSPEDATLFRDLFNELTTIQKIS